MLLRNVRKLYYVEWQVRRLNHTVHNQFIARGGRMRVGMMAATPLTSFHYSTFLCYHYIRHSPHLIPLLHLFMLLLHKALHSPHSTTPPLYAATPQSPRPLYAATPHSFHYSTSVFPPLKSIPTLHCTPTFKSTFPSHSTRLHHPSIESCH